MYYDRLGKEITPDTWTKLYSDIAYRLIRCTKIVTPQYHNEISTAWLGLDHPFSANPKEYVIFGTMIFSYSPDKFRDSEMYRYTSETEAKEHHQILVDSFRSNDLFKDALFTEIREEIINQERSKGR